MQLALALQIPWFSSKWFAYKLLYGIGLTLFISEQPPGTNVFRLMVGHYLGLIVGVEIKFDITFAPQPWGFGVNIIALILVLALGVYARRSSTPSEITEPTPLALPSSMGGK
jgi:uncharacterized membrane protein YccC